MASVPAPLWVVEWWTNCIRERTPDEPIGNTRTPTSHSLWDGSQWSNRRALEEGWLIGWPMGVGMSELALLGLAQKGTGLDYKQLANVELFVVMQAHNGSAYHLHALEIVRKSREHLSAAKEDEHG